MKPIKKSRFFCLHPKINKGKLDTLEALHVECCSYAKVCLREMLERKQYKLKREEKQAFFPPAENLSSQIEKNVRAQVIGLVVGWVKGQYATRIKKRIQEFKHNKSITPDQARQLFTIGKFTVLESTDTIPQDMVDFYWDFIFEFNRGNPPKVRDSFPMLLSEMTSSFTDPEDTVLADFWLKISNLQRRKVIWLPLVGNHYIRHANDVGKGIIARKTKCGKWGFGA
ncbi:MAG: hypothetical protein WC824_10885, partial [Bacteroidota bacterium]